MMHFVAVEAAKCIFMVKYFILDLRRESICVIIISMGRLKSAGETLSQKR